MAFLDDPYQFLPQPPTYDLLEYQGDFLEALLGSTPTIESKAQIEALLNASQSAVGHATPYNNVNAIIYHHEPKTRRVVINGVRTTIQDTEVRLYVPTVDTEGNDVIGAVTTNLSDLP